MLRNFNNIISRFILFTFNGKIIWSVLLLIGWYFHAKLYTVHGPFLRLSDWEVRPSWALWVQNMRWFVRIMGVISFLYLMMLEIQYASLSKILKKTVDKTVSLYVLLVVLGLISGFDFFMPGYLRATDDAESYTTLAWLIRDSLMRGSLPIWSNWGDMGFPLMQFYSPLYSTFIAVISFVTDNVWNAVKILHIILHILSLFAIYYYVSNLTKSKYAGLVSSFALGFAFYRYHVFFYVGVLNMAPTFVLFPMQLYLVDRFLDINKNVRVGIKLAIISAIGLLCHAYFGGYSGLFVGLYVVLRVFTLPLLNSSLKVRIGTISKLYFWLFMGMLASLFYTLPALLESHLSTVQEWVVDDFLLPPMSLTDVLTFDGSQGGNGWWGGYIGLSVVSISLIGYSWVIIKRRSYGIAPLLILLVTFFLALAPYYIDFFEIFNSFPGGRIVFLFHSPGDYLVYVVIMASVGVGMCMSEIQNFIENLTIRKTITTFLFIRNFRYCERILFVLCMLIALDMFRFSLFVNYMIPETKYGSPENRVLVHEWLNDNADKIDGRVLDINQSDIVWHIPMIASLPTYVTNGNSSRYSASFVVGLRRFDPVELFDVGFDLMSIANTSIVVVDAPSALESFPGAISIDNDAVIVPHTSGMAMMASNRLKQIDIEVDFLDMEQSYMLDHTPYSLLANQMEINYSTFTSDFLPVTMLIESMLSVKENVPLVMDIYDHQMESQYVKMQYSLSSAAYLQLSYSYYPFLRVLLDGEPVNIFPTAFGLIGLESPAGVHTIEIVPYLSPLRVFVGIVNVCTIFVLIVLWLWLPRRNSNNDHINLLCNAKK